MSNRFRADKYDELMKKYKEAHECCPECGAIGHRTTLMAYILDWSDPHSFKDENHCTCTECGDEHIAHDRVPKNQE